MPMMVMLIAALGTVFAFGVRSYLFLMSDWALQEQVGYAVERMASDLRYAEKVLIADGRLKVYYRPGSGGAQWVEYEKTRERYPRIMRDDQPLTGQSILGLIAMRDFELEMVGMKTVFLRLEGENTLTGRKYELETAVTWPGEGP